MDAKIDSKIDGLRTELMSEIGGLKADVGVLKADVGVLKADVGVLKADVGVLKADVGVLKADVGVLKVTTRNTAIVVAGHTEAFVQLNERMVKRDELDGLKKSFDVFASEITASRHERALTDKTFSDQQATLTDHELRLTRIEPRGKQT